MVRAVGSHIFSHSLWTGTSIFLPNVMLFKGRRWELLLDISSAPRRWCEIILIKMCAWVFSSYLKSPYYQPSLWNRQISTCIPNIWNDPWAFLFILSSRSTSSARAELHVKSRWIPPNNVCIREVLFLKLQILIAWMFYGFNEKFNSFKICISIIVKSCNGLPAVFRSVIQTPLLSPESHWMLHKGRKLPAKQINKTIPSLWHEPGFVQRPRWDPEPLSGAEPLLRSAWGGNAAQVL